jgi:hypothetical protein
MRREEKHAQLSLQVVVLSCDGQKSWLALSGISTQKEKVNTSAKSEY